MKLASAQFRRLEVKKSQKEVRKINNDRDGSWNHLRPRTQPHCVEPLISLLNITIIFIMYLR